MKPGRLEEIVYNLLKSYELPSFLQTLEREQRIEETTPAAQLDWQNLPCNPALICSLMYAQLPLI